MSNIKYLNKHRFRRDYVNKQELHGKFYSLKAIDQQIDSNKLSELQGISNYEYVFTNRLTQKNDDQYQSSRNDD